jgi:lysophospholipase
MEQAPFFHDIAEGPAAANAYWLRADDGVRLRLGHWPAGQMGYAVLFPGRTEYLEKFGRLAAQLATHGYGLLAIDWRGQGLADRLLSDPLIGHVGDFADYQRDVATFLSAASTIAGGSNLPAFAHSMGGCIALRALLNGWQPCAIAFSSPMWGLPLARHVAFAASALGDVAGLMGADTGYAPSTGPEFGIADMGFDDNVLTTDAATYRYIQAQVWAQKSLQIAGPSLRWLASALREMSALERLSSPDVPAFCGVASREKVVSAPAIEARMARWRRGTVQHYAGAEHELLMEQAQTRDDFVQRALALFATTPSPA